MNKGIVIHALGINTEHPEGFVIDRPKGVNAYIIMNFSNPFFIKTINGMYYGDGGECIIHSKAFNQYHGPVENATEGFTNSWIAFSSKYLDSLMVNYQLEYNQIYNLHKKYLLNDFLTQLQTELLEKKIFYQENSAMIIEKMLLTISRNVKHDSMMEFLSPNEMVHYHALQEIRQTILMNISEKWTIKMMSDIVNISESRFSVLYKKYFYETPINDLIHRRINQAKTMLLDTNDSIENIGIVCGFNNPSHFSNVFKQKVGISPNKFRKP